MRIPFLEVCTDITRKAKKIPQIEYLSNGKYRIFDQGKEYCSGYWDNSEGLVENSPFIVFGDHTRILKYVEEPCFIGADGVKLLKVTNPDFIPKYVYYALLADPINNQGYSRHFKYLKEKTIPYIDKASQEKIVLELDKLNGLLTEKNLQSKLLEESIKSKFEELFGDPVLNNLDWPTECLEECCPITQNKKSITPREDGTVWLLNLDEVESNTGRIIEMNYVMPEKIGASTITFSTDNVLYSKLRPYLNKVVLPPEDGYATSELLPLLPNNNIRKVFLLYLLRNDNFVAYINGKSGGTKMPRVSMDAFRNFAIIEPPIATQIEFETFVENVETSKNIIQQQIVEIDELFDSRLDTYFRQ